MAGTFDIRPPFPRSRLILGLAFLCTGLLLLTDQKGSGMSLWLPILVGTVFTAAGAAITFVERVITFDPPARRAHTRWKVAGLPLSRKSHDLTGADRIVLDSQQEVVIPEPGLLFVADFTYPVIVVGRGGEALLYATGRNCHSKLWGVPVQVSLPSWSFFPSYSRHVAALLATKLDLPLEHRLEKLLWEPGEIPKDWLDPGSVQPVLNWRRY